MVKRLLCMGIMFLSSWAHSVDWGVEISSGLEYTSNAFLDENASVSGLERNISLATDVNHQGTRSSAVGNYQMTRNYYPESFITDMTVQGGAKLSVDILPRNVSWNTSHVRTDTLRDFNDNDTPENRVIRQDFQTGPLLSMRLTPLDTVQSSATRSWKTTESDSSLDSETDSVSINYNRLINSKTDLVLSVSSSDVSFELAQGYETQSETITLNRQIKDGKLSLQIGSNKVSQVLMTTRSPTVNLSISKTLFQANVSLSYRKLLTHTSVDFSELGLNTPFFGVSGFTEVIEKEIFRFSLSRRVADAVDVNVSAYSDTSNSETSNITSDRKGLTAQLGYSRPLSSFSSANVNYTFNYLDDGTNDNSTVQYVSLGYKRSISRKLSLSSGVDYSVRSGSIANDYSRSGVSAQLTYLLR